MEPSYLSALVRALAYIHQMQHEVLITMHMEAQQEDLQVSGGPDPVIGYPSQSAHGSHKLSPRPPHQDWAAG